MIIATPGSSEMWGELSRTGVPSAVMMPQSAVGGWIPIPRKLNPAPMTIMAPTIVVE